MMKTNESDNILDRLLGKLLSLTKQIYLIEQDDDSGLPESFIPGKRTIHPLLRSSYNIEWWTTSGTIECCEDIANLSISFDPQLEGGDRVSFVEIIRDTFRENACNENIFKCDSIFPKETNTLFEARKIESPKEFAFCLWNEIHKNLVDSQVKWLTMYPLRLVKVDSYAFGFDGLTLLRADDQQRWKQISVKYHDSQYWMPDTGDWADGMNGHTVEDLRHSKTWLVCEALGTESTSRSFSSDNMRTFIAVLLSFLGKNNPYLLQKRSADTASYSIQFSGDPRKTACGASIATIGSLFPPLPIADFLDIPTTVLSMVQNWYKSRATTSKSLAQRATTAAHFIHYGIIHEDIERFIHFFIALDALFGERNKVEKNIKAGINKIFSEQTDWVDRIGKLFKLRSELVHGGISSINKWDGLAKYRNHFRSEPIQDIQIAATTALRSYFSDEGFDFLFEVAPSASANTESLYDTDFHAWTQTQSLLLRNQQWQQIDLDNVIEEIESLGRQQRQELRNRLAVLIGHLLKWEYQSEKRSRSWLATISIQRIDIAALIADNPSLQPYLNEAMEVAYRKGRMLAVKETELPQKTFPSKATYSLENVLLENFHPGEESDLLDPDN